jgi:hypothetical protein
MALIYANAFCRWSFLQARNRFDTEQKKGTNLRLLYLGCQNCAKAALGVNEWHVLWPKVAR